jgi:hypothetical protein
MNDLRVEIRDGRTGERLYLLDSIGQDDRGGGEG